MKNRPNILFITDDQHRYDYLEMVSKFPVKTPNIARLAEEGVWYNHAYSVNPLCMPARCSLHNGLYTHQHGMTENGEHWDFNLPTVQQALQKHGYTTAAIGKLHVFNGDVDLTTLKGDIQSLGYDYVHEVSGKALAWHEQCEWTHAMEKQGKLEKYRKARHFHEKEVCGRDKYAHRFVLDEEDYMDRYIGDHVVDFLKNHNYEKPLFMWAGLVSPHYPFDATDEMLKGHELTEQPDAVDNEQPQLWQANRQHYSAMVEEVDKQAGRMLKALEEKGQLDNTLVIFTSDHGEMLGDHGLEGKCHPFDPSVRVPLLMRYPAAIKPGTICNSIIELTDLPATLLDFAGITTEPETVLPRTPGKSVIPTWQNINHEIRPFAYSESYVCYPPFQMIRNHQFKLVYYQDKKEFSLYDIQNDPDECINLAGRNEYSEIIKEMSTDLLKHIVTYRAPIRK